MGQGAPTCRSSSPVAVAADHNDNQDAEIDRILKAFRLNA